jgi:hypothetical protein
MNIKTMRHAAILLCCGLVAACNEEGPPPLASASFGEATRQTFMAQVIDPDPQYDQAFTGDAGNAARAIDRYRHDEVQQPERMNTSNVYRNNGSNGGGSSSSMGH